MSRLSGKQDDVPLALDVHSGFRTPIHNRRVKRAARDSRHQYGDAADVAIDSNGDGRISFADTRLVARAVEAVEQAHPGPRGRHGPLQPRGCLVCAHRCSRTTGPLARLIHEPVPARPHPPKARPDPG